MKNIYPCLWFENNGTEASDFYCDVFGSSIILSRNPMVTVFEVHGCKFMALTGGPSYKVNPAVSYFVKCKNEEEIDGYYERLSAGGMPLMALGKYPWGEKYAWIQDRYGVNWQLILGGNMEGVKEKFMPSIMFVHQNNGKAEEAIHYYTSIFPESKIEAISRYGSSDPDTTGHVNFSHFLLNGESFGAMDSGFDHQFDLTPGNSFVVLCKDQTEVDHFWNSLIADGGKESRCGWLLDKYGLSWQIIPSRFMELISTGDPTVTQRVLQAMAPMNKLIIAEFEKAAKG